MDQYQVQKLITISCCLDDLNPEIMPIVLEKLINKGARDAFLTPVIMKKGRPGFKLEVLCDLILKENILEIIFLETSTLGVKISEVDRIELTRREDIVEVNGCKIRVKLGYLPNQKLVNVKPEFDDCLKTAETLNLPVKEVIRLAMFQANNLS